ncbi:MAG TPA: hypothetical protein VGG47_05625 [Acidocella sp.]
MRNKAVTVNAFEIQIGVMAPKMVKDSEEVVKTTSGSTTASQRGGAVILKPPMDMDESGCNTSIRSVPKRLSGSAKYSKFSNIL